MARDIRYCETDGCDERVHAHGFCATHWARIRRHEPERAAALQAQPRPSQPQKPCTIDGCAKSAIAHGMCSWHYRKRHRETAPSRKRCDIQGCDRTFYALGMCQLHYRRLQQTGTTDAPRQPTTEERFWQKVRMAGSDECWEWQGAKLHGHGQFYNGVGGNKIAHRVAYELLVGPIPAGAHLHHRCVNRSCVNPVHLEPIMPDAHQILTMAQTLRSLGYTVTEPDSHK